MNQNNRRCTFVRSLALGLLSILSVLVGISSCSNPLSESTTPSPTPSDNSYITYSVGRGYNVFDEYADEASLRDPVLDYDKMYSVGVVAVENAEKTNTRVASGESKADYAKSLQVDLSVSGSYGAFSGSVESHFANDFSSSVSKSYYTVLSLVRKKRVKVASSYISTPNSLRAYLTDKAAAAIDGTDTTYADPSKLFSAYGTHVMTWAYYGGRLDYSVQTDTSQYKGSMSASAMAQASYDSGVASLSSEVKAAYSSNYDNFNKYSKTEISLVGGDSASGNLSLTPESYAAWAAKFDDPNYQVLCDFETGEGNISLLPIWSLCDTSTEAGVARQATLKNAFLAYAKTASDFTSTGSLTVNLYYLYNYAGYNNPKYTWDYQYKFVGLNSTGSILQNTSTQVERAYNTYINYVSDGTWTANDIDNSTFFTATYDLNNLSKLTSVILPVVLTGNVSSDKMVSVGDNAQYTLIYDSLADSFTAQNPADSSYFFGSYVTGSTSLPTSLPASWKLTRGGEEQIVNLARSWNSNSRNKYIFTKVGLIWK